MNKALTAPALSIGAATLALGMLLAGCGSSGTAASNPSTSAGGSSSTTALSSSPTSSSPPPSAVTINLSGNFCANARTESKSSAQLASSLGTDSPAAFKKFEQSLAAILVQFQAEAPAAIRAPVAVIVKGDQALLKQLAAAHYDYSKLNPAALSALATPAFLAASKQVTAYLTTTCHIAPTG